MSSALSFRLKSPVTIANAIGFWIWIALLLLPMPFVCCLQLSYFFGALLLLLLNVPYLLFLASIGQCDCGDDFAASHNILKQFCPSVSRKIMCKYFK